MTRLSRPTLNYLYIYVYMNLLTIFIRPALSATSTIPLQLRFTFCLLRLNGHQLFLLPCCIRSVCVVSRTSVFPRITSSLRSVCGKGLEALCSVRLDGSSVANFVQSSTGFEPDGHRRITFRNSELYDRIFATQA